MRSSRCFSFALAIVVAASTLSPFAAGAQAGPTMDQAIAAIAAYAPRALAEQGAPGLSVAITDRTHTIDILTLGYANVAARAPVTENTRFPIGSISKSMTALALLQLHDRGKIDLDAPVTKYLPWWSIHSNGKPILVHQLLSHTGGIPDDFSFVSAYGFAIAALRDAHTLFAPGTSWSYSNDGFGTVGAIVAAVSGRPWRDAISTTVFAPIGMTHSSAFFTPALMNDAATGYLERDADLPTPPRPPLVPAQNYDFVDPAGSVISTPGDMAQYLRFFLNGGKTAGGTQLIAPATFHAMTTPDMLNDGKPAGSPETELAEWPDFYKLYGYGLSIFDTNGDRLIGHTGGVSGYTACMQANLTHGFGVIAMSNLVEAPLHPCAIVKYAMAVLRAQSLGQPLPPQPEPPESPEIIANSQEYAGDFTASDGTKINFTSAGQTLTLMDGDNSYHMVGRGGDLFYTDDPRFSRFYLAFARNKGKIVDEVTYGPDLYTNSTYSGPTTFAHPSSYDALTGRYETVVWGQPDVTRVVIVKGKLTFDGITPLTPGPNGTFLLGKSVVRFDTPAGGAMQRMWLDASDFYRVELP